MSDKGEKGDTGPTGAPGATGADGAVGAAGAVGADGAVGAPGAVADPAILIGVGSDIRDLVAVIKDLIASQTNLSKSTAKQVRSALWLNVISTVLAFLIIPTMAIGAVLITDSLHSVHQTQHTNTAINKTDNDILQYVKNAVGPAGEKKSAAAIEALFKQTEVCIENHGDRARDAIAHITPPPLAKGCAANNG